MAILIIFLGALLIGVTFVAWLCFLIMFCCDLIQLWGGDRTSDIMGVCLILFWALAPIFGGLAIVQLLA